MADLSIYLSAAALAACPPQMNTKAFADWRLLQAVALVESGANSKAIGDGGRAKGAWQMHQPAWSDAHAWQREHGGKAWPFSSWQNVEAQRTMAHAYLKVCQWRLETLAGIEKPTVRQIYLCFAMGYEGFKRINFDPTLAPEHKRDASERVEAIFVNGK
jgi:hypothetical protein